METHAQEHGTTAIVGLNASGKTQLVERMRRQMASDSVRYVAFCDTYGPVTDRQYYLQQRWNQHDIDQETPTVVSALERSLLLSGPDNSERRQHLARLVDLFGMREQLDKYVIFLSSGELRKLQLVKTLLASPKILILDNPFIGLDAEARQMLSDQLRVLSSAGMLKLYLVLSRESDIPSFTDEVIRVDGLGGRWMVDGDWRIDASAPNYPPSSIHHPPVTKNIHQSPVTKNIYQSPSTIHQKHNPGEPVIELHNVSIIYGTRTIFNNLSWTVRRGEHWALMGRNGSGKSTLLSLICADNPQGYACDITLFGRSRGSGETIWDIKRRIGYVSPEMHRSYQRPLPVIDVVASGLKNTVGLYTRPTPVEREQCQRWLQLFHIDSLSHRSFLSLSSGEQRMVLLARAFVKDPELLILDEPFHGLDDCNRQLASDIITAYCSDPLKTLIMVTHYEDELPPCVTLRLTL